MRHSRITSPTFVLIRTLEFDLDLSNQDDADMFSLRVELFQALSDSEVFRYKVWRTESFRIQSTFPQGRSGLPRHKASDENILIEFGVKYFGNVDSFRAKTVEKATMKIMRNFRRAIEHISGEKMSKDESATNKVK
ncbi:MAG: hypothetical protein ACD_39C01981G0003 [uncultured bacterium]|nr:MAG: hypothetical protein ACD_39C01981G0003 [uncultured bacterium]